MPQPKKSANISGGLFRSCNVTSAVWCENVPNMGYTFMLRTKQSQKYLIGRSYNNDEFDWPFDLVIVKLKNNLNTEIGHDFMHVLTKLRNVNKRLKMLPLWAWTQIPATYIFKLQNALLRYFIHLLFSNNHYITFFQFAEQTIIILHVFQSETLIWITIQRLRVNHDTLTHVIDKNEYCHKLAIFKSFIISQE